MLGYWPFRVNPMQLTEYQTASRETALYPDRDSNLWYPALGLIGEYHEWQMATDETNRRKEAGDVAWYCAQICSELKEDLAATIAQPLTTDSSALVLMTLAEGVKKWHRDGGDDKKRHNILASVAWIWQTVVQQSTAEETTALLTGNIQKLRDRKDRGVLQGSGDNR
jgi:NTP pyrophosphatase (non-canonical NTP hydrolase)